MGNNYISSKSKRIFCFHKIQSPNSAFRIGIDTCTFETSDHGPQYTNEAIGGERAGTIIRHCVASWLNHMPQNCIPKSYIFSSRVRVRFRGRVTVERNRKPRAPAEWELERQCRRKGLAAKWNILWEPLWCPTPTGALGFLSHNPSSNPKSKPNWRLSQHLPRQKGWIWIRRGNDVRLIDRVGLRRGFQSEGCYGNSLKTSLCSRRYSLSFLCQNLCLESQIRIFLLERYFNG